MEFLAYTTAFSLGLLGSLHCVVMCGGISCMFGSLANSDEPLQKLLPLLSINVGRIGSYAIAGAALGWGAAAMLEHWQSLSLVFRGLAGALLMAMGLYIAGLSGRITRLEQWVYRGGQTLTTVARSLLAAGNSSSNSSANSSPGISVVNTVSLNPPVAGQRSDAVSRSLLAGALWGWLPCGLVYSTLLWAAAQGGGAVKTGILMFAFGLGTAPAMLITGLFGKVLADFVRARSVRLIAGFCIVVYGIWTLAGGFAHLSHMSHQDHVGHESHQQHSHH